jgi:hypothetical protein
MVQELGRIAVATACYAAAPTFFARCRCDMLIPVCMPSLRQICARGHRRGRSTCPVSELGGGRRPPAAAVRSPPGRRLWQAATAGGRRPWPRRRPPPHGEDGGRCFEAVAATAAASQRRPPPVPRAVAASAAASKKAPIRALLSLIVVTQISWLRCRRVAGLTLPRCSRLVMTEALGSRPAPGTPSAKRPVGTRRAASMQDTLSEGTARAAQLAPSAATAGAVGGPATRGVVGRVSPKTSGSSRSTRDYTALEAAARPTLVPSLPN